MEITFATSYLCLAGTTYGIELLSQDGGGFVWKISDNNYTGGHKLQ